MEETIGKYKVLREIGKGGMGIVYKGLDPETQRSVAIKILPVNLIDRSTVERFNREARAMAKVHHPNLVEVAEVGMTKGQHFFIMEFVDGESLKTIINNKGAIPEQRALEIIEQVAQGIACIHAEGMIHRDIKPGNIMITAEGKIKVMDFGLVKIPGVTNVTISGSALGTAEYMSPEQVSDECVDTRSDIYSLGVTLYEMLAGRPPFTGENYQAVLMKHKYEVATSLRQLNPRLSQGVEAIVSKAMAKQVSDRYQKLEEMIADIGKLAGMEQRTEKISVPETMREPRGSSRRKFPLGKIFIVLILIGLGYLGYQNRETITDQVSDILSGMNIRKETDLVGETQRQMAQFEKAESHYAQGQKYYRQGLVNKAIAEYKKAINLRRDYAPYYKELALSYEASGDVGRAIEAWKKLLKYASGSSLSSMAQRKIGDLELY